MSAKIDPRTWREADQHEGPGVTAYVRTGAFEHTGNNEGTVTWEVAVCTVAGDVLLHETVRHAWEYHAALDVDFACDGSSVTLSVAGGDATTYPLRA